jgi:RimJ/RimL family protein N-acetyltransferase
MLLDLSLCTVRQWEHNDVPYLVRYANNRNVWINLRNTFPHPYTQADAENYIRASNSQSPVCSFAIEVNGHAVGSIGFILKSDVYQRSIEVGYWLGEEFWGRGIAACALSGLMDYLIHEFDPLRIYACVFDWNKRSGRVLEKAGFQLEGRTQNSVVKDGRVGGEFIYAWIKN